jgi:hypothetical protein
MLAGLSTLVGVQMILGFFAFDLTASPRVPLQVILGTVHKNRLTGDTTISDA